MSSVLFRLAQTMARRRRLVVAGWLVALALMGALAGLVQQGTDDAFTIPGSPSQQALDALKRTFPQASGSSAQIVVTVPSDRADSRPVRRSVDAAIASLQDVPQVAEIVSPYSGLVAGQVSDSGRSVIVSVPLEVDTLEVTQQTRDDIMQRVTQLRQSLPAGSRVDVGGQAFSTIIPQLSLLEAVGVVVAMLTLLALFRSWLASVLPLATAMVGVGVAMALIFAATSVATVSSTAPMLALMLGLAVGIDYALLILSRHRDQLGHGMEPRESIAVSVGTAGSAVVFAALTVIIALLGLGVVGIPFLTVMGVGAALAVAVALLVALTLLPALMAMAGERLRPRPRRRRAAAPGTGRHHVFQDMAHWWVSWITRHPLPTLVGVLALVALLAWPAPSLRLGLPDNGSAPHGSPSRTTYDVIAHEFGPGYNGPLIVTADIVASTDPLGVMKGLKRDIEGMPGVQLVSLATPNRAADTGIVEVVPTTDPLSDETSALVDRIRAAEPAFRQAYGVDTAVTGFTAVGIDVSQQLAASMIPFGVVVVGLCLLLLTLVFRSVLIPLKATVGYLLSVVAAFGATALVFSHGVLADLFRVARVGPVISFLPILLMGVLFGLAMDYEVFIVSRMAEEHARTSDPREAVVEGFTASAPVVTAAAIIMLSVFAAFIPAENANLKPIAFGLTVGVAVDAFLVRMTFVPAVMALMGRWAWWVPTWLDRRMPRMDVEGEGVLRERALRDWPEPEATDVVSADEVDIHDSRGRVVASLHEVRLEPGEVLVGVGEPSAQRAAAAVLGGRASAVDGRLKVAGLLLPERAREARRRVEYLPADEIDDLPGALQEVLAGDERAPLAVFEGFAASALAEPAVRTALAGLAESGTGIVILVAQSDGLAGLPGIPTVRRIDPVTRRVGAGGADEEHHLAGHAPSSPADGPPRSVGRPEPAGPARSGPPASAHPSDPTAVRTS